ncbi:neural/ectodermal development factor IMP-L2 [Anopheles arabiensis]|uniref:Ig-like domain-containing protein n=1 Tax=Anopheles arabiensis TaxID=7173 RepID=A0A182HJ33_ANOAR|nr:neural/ectodermal development factor IMP-L2 [Anopheles arabiensis]XP_040156858.1 neural/ectodermal development factor IMP-L2 [Anopheles arabiensis]
MMNVKHLLMLAVCLLPALLVTPGSGRAVVLDPDTALGASASASSSSSSSSGTVVSSAEGSVRAGDGGRAIRPTFVKITAAPPARVAQIRGTTVELECEIMGSPTPTVQWVHGSGQTADWEDISVNVISEDTPTSVARVVTRLVIDRASRASQTTFTCIGRAAGQEVSSSTVVYHVDSVAHLGNYSDVPLLRPVAAVDTMFKNLKGARITLHYKTLFENMGSTVVLPCKAVGRPLPEITWLNEEGNVVGSLQDARFRTLPTGELIITGLRWADMGSYTCVAKNVLAKDESETFVYPIRPN